MKIEDYILASKKPVHPTHLAERFSVSKSKAYNVCVSLLLEALQMLSETAGRVAQGAAVIDERGFNTLSHSISIALAAIAKATGNTNL